MVIFQFHVRMWSEPLALRVAFALPGDKQEKWARWGHYCPSKNEMFILSKQWEETLLHEIVEGTMLNEGLHFTGSDGNETIAMVMNHDQFSAVIKRSYGAYNESWELLNKVFGSSYRGDLYRPSMGLKMAVTGKCEKIETGYRKLLRDSEKGLVPLAGIYLSDDDDIMLEDVDEEHMVWYNKEMCEIG